MSTSKAQILAAIRRNRPAPVELPPTTGEWTTYADRRGQFVEVLEAIGGQAIIGRNLKELDEQLRRLPIYTQAQKIASLVPGLGESNVYLSQIDDPHELANVDVAILAGDFAIAENAAVWVTDRQVPLRVLYFLCQHLVLFVPTKSIVDHLHAAYEIILRGRVSPRRESDTANVASHDPDSSAPHSFTKPMFGTFIAGPSKTADIEQSLVIGAHGPRSLTVCLLENDD